MAFYDVACAVAALVKNVQEARKVALSKDFEYTHLADNIEAAGSKVASLQEEIKGRLENFDKEFLSDDMIPAFADDEVDTTGLVLLEDGSASAAAASSSSSEGGGGGGGGGGKGEGGVAPPPPESSGDQQAGTGLWLLLIL